jgi:hypothetical protein
LALIAILRVRAPLQIHEEIAGWVIAGQFVLNEKQVLSCAALVIA